MIGDPSPWIVVGQGRSKRSLRDAELVLRAQGIPFVIEHRGDHFVLGVQREHADTAREELTRFAREEAENVPEPVPEIRPGQFWWQGVVLYVGVLILAHVFATEGALDASWYGRGAADAGAILAGEAWRTVTALFLHSDVPHLGSNLLYGSLFAGLVAYVRGGGVTFLAMLLCGALGNAINAFAQDPAHLSVGASTAVFGAVGLLCGSEWRRRALLRVGPARRFGPVFLALVLFSWLGIGENPIQERIDVFAHVFGLLVGLAGGALLASLPKSWPERRSVQYVAGALTLVVALGAWAIALS